MLTLLWLTVSAPFIADLKKDLQKTNTSITAALDDAGKATEEAADPFSGLNEEKSGSSTATLSEYLHEPFHLPVTTPFQLVHESCSRSLIYVSFYGELLSPPPEA